MAHFSFILLLVHIFLLQQPVLAQTSSRSNVAVYYGQGPNQKRLINYCRQPTIDTIILSFVHVFPKQGNGWPGTNFGNQCAIGHVVFYGPGDDHAKDDLQSSCPELYEDVPLCQKKYGKKILLSLGGGTETYHLGGESDGKEFAEFLFGAFGPQRQPWIDGGLPRPLEGPSGEAVEVDGYDFDVEFQPTDNSVGYIALINHLRHLYETQNPCKELLITAAPQCTVPDINMAPMIAQAKFDILHIQFYNTPRCSARSWVTANPDHPTVAEKPSGFQSSFEAWHASLANTTSKDAKIYIGLPGSISAVWDLSSYIPVANAANLLSAYFCHSRFAGVSIWEATHADENPSRDGSGNFYQSIKKILNMLAADKNSGCYEK